MKQLLTLLLLVPALLAGCSQEKQASATQVSKVTTASQHNRAASRSLSAVQKDNRALQASNSRMQADLSSYQQAAKDAAADQSEQLAKAGKVSSAPAAKPTADTAASLASRDYAGQQEIVVNNDNPGFSAAELSTAKGGWEQYADLDGNNRAVDAQALLNQSLMPTAKREPLTWDPTGWHNRRTAHGWLYNRSHLIGFQLSGENNNPKNLITGTMSLNNPLMLAHEMDIATYLKASASHFVRYEVKPVYRGSELVARGVWMRAQSIGDHDIAFNVYIFNVEDGYTIDYNTGTSTTN